MPVLQRARTRRPRLDQALTALDHGDVPDEVYALARNEFSEQELVNLTLAIMAINGANRVNIAFRASPGDYKVHGAGWGMPEHVSTTEKLRPKIWPLTNPLDQ